MTVEEELLVADADAWRQWLATRELDSSGVWLVLAKKGATQPTSLTYDQALEEALCCGWIGLDGTFTWRDETTVARAGWWRHKPNPIPMELDHPNGREWMVRLAELSALYSELAPALRLRVDTCLDWLDVAALSDRWRIIIPAIFSGMEALLVPETVGLKAEVVTIRSVAVHVALGHGFFDPGEILAAYSLRNDLIHGNPTAEIIEKDASDFADFRRLWSFRVLCDYLELANRIGASTVRDLVTHLDHGACNEVCDWLADHSGSGVVGEYRKVVPAAPSSSGTTSPPAEMG